MPEAAKILVVDGNTATTNAANEAAGGRANGVQYAAVLARLLASVETVIVAPSEEGPDCLPRGFALTDFDGIAWTGSALNIYDDSIAIRNQLALATRARRSGVPVFGSCWGLQVFTVALGGTVRKNPLGRELGVACCLHLTEAGQQHPMFAHKPPAFDALAIHTDEIETPPDGAVLLASNAVSKWQAMSIENSEGSFWGVQYHPELNFGTCATVFKRYGRRLVDEGLFADEASLAQTVADFRALHADSSRRDLAFRYGITAHITDRGIHERELTNWLTSRVCRAEQPPRSAA